MAARDYEIGYGQLRRSTQDRGPEYWGRVRVTRAQLNTLVAWANANAETAGPNGDLAWELELAGWVREGPSGKYFSLSLSQPYKSNRVGPDGVQLAPPAQSRPAAASVPDHDLPF